MKKTKAIILGIFTILPTLYLIFFLCVFSYLFMSTLNESNADVSNNLFKIIFPMHMTAMLLIFTLMIIYIVDVFKNNSVESDKKSLWAIVLFFGNIISMIVYWVIHIWEPLVKENKIKQIPKQTE